MPDLRETFREGPQPERAHVYGPSTDSGGGSEKQQSAAAVTVRPADHHSDRRGGPARPGEVTAESPGLLPGYVNPRTEISSERFDCRILFGGGFFSLISGYVLW